MKRLITFGLLFAICWLGFVSGLTSNGCPHCWPRGTKGDKPYVCTKRGQCPCRHGHTNFRCSGCLPGFHPNGAYCCEKEKYHIGRLRCEDCECNPDGVNTTVIRHCNRKGICTCREGYGGPKCFEKTGPDCECNPDGVKKDVIKQCNDQEICTCRPGYGGPKCFKPSAQEAHLGSNMFEALFSVYCNGKCKIHYIRVLSLTNLDGLKVSDKPYVYNAQTQEVTTEGQSLCEGESVQVPNGEPKKEECKNIAGIEVTDFHIFVNQAGINHDVILQFDADNYLRYTIQKIWN